MKKQSLSDFLVARKSHPKLTPLNERAKLTEAEAQKRGTALPKDHPVYQEGHGIGLTRK